MASSVHGRGAPLRWRMHLGRRRRSLKQCGMVLVAFLSQIPERSVVASLRPESGVNLMSDFLR